MIIEPKEIKGALTTLFEKYKESIWDEYNRHTNDEEYSWEKREKYINEKVNFVGFMKFIRNYEDEINK